MERNSIGIRISKIRNNEVALGNGNNFASFVLLAALRASAGK
jgi:hypothetical protein